MKLKKVLAIVMSTVLTASLIACGNAQEEKTYEDVTQTSETSDETKQGNTESAEETQEGVPSYSQINVGTDYLDFTASIKWTTHRTDRGEDGTLDAIVADFNKVYPNISVEVEAIPDFAEEALLRLTAGDYADIMAIPAIDKAEYGTYFYPLDTFENMDKEINFASQTEYDGYTYGIPYMANAQGVLYNKAVFEKAGVTTLPKTPDEFVDALKAIKENTDAIPLYTNYAAGWTMGAWDAYIGCVSNGDATYINQKFVHTANPFADNGDGTGAYALYKILYDAVADGLIEDEYTTTDWEGCKGMLNRGEIGAMVLGSWSYAQMVEADVHGEDVGYMPFPITVNGTQYALAAGDYASAINIHSSDENKTASMIFLKWLTEDSGWCYNEGGYMVDKEGQNPEMYTAFDTCTVLSDASALEGEADLLNEMNAESELSFNAGGDAKVQRIVEAASTGSESFDEIMAEWTKAWNEAQKTLGIEVLY